LKQGGRVDCFKDDENNDIGPHRVWLRDQNLPGLAMSRSIGDLVAESVGVSYTPDIKKFNIE